jgi:hypothetical protein
MQNLIISMDALVVCSEIALVQERPRTATVKTLTRCVLLSITKANFQAFFASAPEAIADFEVKILRAGVQFRSVLYHQLGYEYFVQHCKNEYSTENIEFWRDCRYAVMPRCPALLGTDEWSEVKWRADALGGW